MNLKKQFLKSKTNTKNVKTYENKRTMKSLNSILKEKFKIS